MEIAGRLPKLRAALKDCDALLVTNLTNVRYLTGFTGSAALLLVTPDELVLATDGRYAFQSAEQLKAAGVEARIEIGNLAGQKAAISGAAAGVKRVGLEATDVTWARQRSFAADWFARSNSSRPRTSSRNCAASRTPANCTHAARPPRIADEALANVRPLLADGISERDFAIALDFEIRKLGASGNSFETIVAAGPNGAKPHARPSDRVIRDRRTRRARLRRHRRRLLLRHDPHRVRR